MSNFLGGAGANSGSGDSNIPQESCERCFRRKTIRITLRTLNLLAVVIFLASAILQYNDNDGYLWGVIYFIAFIFCALAELSWQKLRTYIFRPLLCLFTFSTFVGAIYILIARLLLREGINEEIYEFLGLLLVTIWMLVVLLLDRYKVVGLFGGYTSLDREHERDKEGNVQMGEVVL